MIEIIHNTLLAWLLNNAYAASALCIAGIAILIGQLLFGGRLRIATELYKANMAVAIVMAAVILGACLVVSSANGADHQTSIKTTQAKKTGTDPRKKISPLAETNRYDRYFKHYSRRYFARALDWRWIKAQGSAESNLNPKAVSPAGAKGLMQILDSTGTELARNLNVLYQPFNPRLSIMLAVAYDRQLWDIWKDERGLERVRYMLGSYHSGPGNIGKAQAKTAKYGYSQDQWQSIVVVLPEITGRHAKDTILYVARVEYLFNRLCNG